MPLTLSESAKSKGLKAVVKGPESKYQDAALHKYLRLAIYAGKGLKAYFQPPLLAGLILFVLIFPYAIYRDIRRMKQMKYGRLLKGPILCDPRSFNKEIQGDGIGFRTTEHGQIIRIPRSAEAKHFEIIADTGAGKTALIFQMLLQIQARKEGAIIYDPACEFVQRFYDPDRGDIVLNPLDARCPYWGPAEELKRKAEARTLAASLFQSTQDRKGEFFVEIRKQIVSPVRRSPTVEGVAGGGPSRGGNGVRIAEVVVFDLSLLSGREEGSGGAGGYSRSASSSSSAASFDQRPPAAAGPPDDFAQTEISDDDIPF